MSGTREIELKYKSTNEMVADILTKGLPKPKHLYCVEKMGIKDYKTQFKMIKIKFMFKFSFIVQINLVQ